MLFAEFRVNMNKRHHRTLCGSDQVSAYRLESQLLTGKQSSPSMLRTVVLSSAPCLPHAWLPPVLPSSALCHMHCEKLLVNECCQGDCRRSTQAPKGADKHEQ